VFFYLDSSIVDAKWLTAQEKDILARNLESEEKHKSEVRVGDAFRSGKVWALCAIYFTLMIGLYGISFWLPTIVKAFGVKGYLRIGLITAIPYFVAVVGMLILSRSSDRTGERRLHYVFNVIAGAIGLILSGVFASNPYLSIVFLSVGTLGVIGSMPIFWPIPSAFLAGTASAAGIGLVNSIGNLGGYVGPNLPVWAKAYTTNPSAALYVIAAALGVGAILTFFLIPADLSVRVGQAPARA
jgi:nitrate/nitrite transporter NarK